jgi:hypothetical protein
MEKTHTWYGMFLEDGSRTAAVDVMTHLWTGQWPTNRCPDLAPVPIELTAPEGDRRGDPGTFQPGATLNARVDASDPEGDALKVSWDVRRDVADDPRVGGDYEPLEPALPGAVLESDGDHAVIRLPESPGKYRVFVYVRDGHGGAATANVPILLP